MTLMPQSLYRQTSNYRQASKIGMDRIMNIYFSTLLATMFGLLVWWSFLIISCLKRINLSSFQKGKNYSIDVGYKKDLDEAILAPIWYKLAIYEWADELD
jgi:hypothetical protein